MDFFGKNHQTQVFLIQPVLPAIAWWNIEGDHRIEAWWRLALRTSDIILHHEKTLRFADFAQ